MSEERVQFIKEQLAGGKTVDEIRREAISHGHGTDGFDDDFAAASGASEVPVLADAMPTPPPDAPTVDAATIPVPPPATATSGGSFIGPIELIKESFSVTKENFKLMGGFLVAAIGLMVVGGIFVAILVAVTGASLMGGVSGLLPLLVGILLYLVWLIAFIVATIGLMYALMKRREGVGYWAGVSWALKHFWQIFWVALLLQLVISGGYLFLIIPGLVVALYTSFALFVYVSEGEKGMSALLRSTELVYGNWWGVIGRVLVFLLAILVVGIGFGLVFGIFAMLLGAIDGLGMLLGLLAAVVAGAFYLFIIGWGISFSVVMVESLQSFKPTKGALWDSMKKTRIVYIVLAVIGVPMMFVVQGLSFYDSAGLGATPEADWYLEDGGFGADFEAELERSIQEQIQLELEAQNQI